MRVNEVGAVEAGSALAELSPRGANDPCAIRFSMLDFGCVRNKCILVHILLMASSVTCLTETGLFVKQLRDSLSIRQTNEG